MYQALPTNVPGFTHQKKKNRHYLHGLINLQTQGSKDAQRLFLQVCVYIHICHIIIHICHIIIHICHLQVCGESLGFRV